MKYLLFGHSFVRRVTGRVHGTLRVPIVSGELRVKGFGQGGLFFDRKRSGRDYYINYIRSSCPDVLILDMGTKDLCRHTPREVCFALWEFLEEFGRRGVKPLATVILPVLIRTSVFRGSGVSLDEYNQ